MSKLIFYIAFKYIIFNKHHKFASSIALIATIGIVIGVCALIIVSSIMQGLQTRLQNSLFNDNYHVIAYANENLIKPLLDHNEILAYAPFIEGEVMVQAKEQLLLATLYGIDNQNLAYKDPNQIMRFNLYPQLQKGEYGLCMDRLTIDKDNLNFNGKIRLISLQNARFSPLGITPTQRNFTLVCPLLPSVTNSKPIVITYFDDAQKLLRTKDFAYRLYVSDPNNLSKIEQYLNLHKIKYKTWRDNLGEFFKAVAMEKLTMNIMLCLIIVVAAFNILSAISMMVSSRLHDIAILKTLGMGQNQILFIFIIMGLICSTIGSLLGIVLGITLTLNANEILNILNISIMGSGEQIPVSINIESIFGVFLFTTIITFICAFYPAQKASKAQIVDNLIKVS